MAHPARREPREMRVDRGCRENPAPGVPPDWMDPRDMLASMDLLEIPARQDPLVTRATQEMMAMKASRDRQVLRVPLVYQVMPVSQVRTVCKDNKVCLGHRVLWESPGRREIRDLPDPWANEDLQVHPASKDLPEYKDHPDSQDRVERSDLQDHQEPLGSQESWEVPDHLDLRESVERRV